MIGFELDFEIKARFRYRENRGTYPERKNNRRKYRNGKVCCIFCMMWFRSIWANYISIAKFKQRANHTSKVKNFCYKITLN